MNIKEIKNKIVNWIIIKYFIFKGWKISKKFIKNETYYNTLKNIYGIYRGNNTFFETQQCVVPEAGTIFYDSRNVKYTNLQIGLFELWKKVDRNSVEIITDGGNDLLNNPF